MRAGMLWAVAFATLIVSAAPSFAEGPARPPSSTAPANRPQAEEIAEKDAFDLAKEIGTEAAWRAFIERFPDGFYADLARAAISKPAPAARPAPEPAALPAPSGGSFWNHNGSLMRLETDGSDRRFYYERPRPGMIAQGARKGALLFDGIRVGERYEGTAYIFSKRCGVFPYAVSGSVEDGDRRVVMRGRAPKPGADCGVASHRDDTLVFEYEGR
jgi:hypothetical protein